MFDELSDKLGNVFAKLRGRGVLTDADIKEGLREVRRVAQQTCRRDPRSAPGTLELLHEPSLWDFAFAASERTPTEEKQPQVETRA